MPVQRRTRWLVVGAMGTAAMGLALGSFAWNRTRVQNVKPTPATSSKAGADENQGSGLNERLREGVPQALIELQSQLVSNKGEPIVQKALSQDEAARWIETLKSLRAGFLKNPASSRGSSGLLSALVLNKFAVDPAPPTWIEALPPVHDILSACLTDSEPVVRVIGLTEVSKLWSWMPGRTLTPVEEQILANWKQGLHQPVVRCLASRDAATRISAVACLGTLHLDEAAAPAVAYLEDKENVDVRKQALVSFAQRPTLLTDEMLLKRIHDADMSIRETVLAVLKARGLTSEQITLGSLIFHPKPELRLSVIPQLKDRTDIDPIIWLLELSHDPVDSVRIGAIQALAGQKVRPVSVVRRLEEIANSDRSAEVRQAARKLVPKADETTASLPPLPGSSALNPRAN
ncbi:MAG: hypothetical protein ABS79_03190 [Planctomycetes bacterium SCN 63-9]|nr:MAG: hypothetical protein ABS79_03190 [Planctomycetes bacterium SCN 63-9]